MNIALNIKIEEAIRFMTENFPITDSDSRKAVLFHDIRVGVYLYEHDYNENIVLAGLLHDVIEWSDVTAEIVEEKFGTQILKLILANSKDDSIKDQQEKTDELIKRCANEGQDALIIKTADILDSFKWYTQQNYPEQIEYCRRNARAILKFKPKEFDDKIFEELTKWLEK